MIKTPNNSPKGIYTHLSTMHKHLKAQIDEQKEVHEEKKEQAKAEKEKTLKKKDPKKQQKLVSNSNN